MGATTSGIRVLDDLPDSSILHVTTTPIVLDDPNYWLDNMDFYLANGVSSPHLSSDERKRLAARSLNSRLLDDILYFLSAVGNTCPCFRHTLRAYAKETEIAVVGAILDHQYSCKRISARHLG